MLEIVGYALGVNLDIPPRLEAENSAPHKSNPSSNDLSIYNPCMRSVQFALGFYRFNVIIDESGLKPVWLTTPEYVLNPAMGQTEKARVLD
jgi:hypothetical protein